MLFSDLFREIIAVVLRIAIGFPLLFVIYVVSAWTASETFVAAVASGSLGAALFILKIHFVVLTNLFLARTTEPQHLVSSLGKLRTPRELCLMIVIILRFFPVMIKEATAVYQAQRARGFELRRAFNPANWLKYERVYLPEYSAMADANNGNQLIDKFHLISSRCRNHNSASKNHYYHSRLCLCNKLFCIYYKE
jgi:hypothetical protein